jgi:hypothetical protein
LQKKIFYFKPPSEKEMQWLNQIYGEVGAMKIVARSDQIRAGSTKKVQKQIGEYMEYDTKQIQSQITDLKTKYGEKIKQYGFPSDIIEEVCFRKIFTNNES